MDDVDVTYKPVNEQPMDTEEYAERSTLVESNHAEGDGSTQSRNEESSGSGVDKNGGGELVRAVTQEMQIGDESSTLDADELEMDDDDITSKLLSIQVLPRIPKRKPATDDSAVTSAGEASSYCSVLERVNSAPSSAGAKFPNWSAAGWSRSGADRLPKRWGRKTANDKKAELKPVKQTVSEKLSSNDATHNSGVTENVSRRAAEHSAWSPDATDISSLSELEQVAANEGSVPTLTGPLPTLPFEEQMRERARLRNLKMQSGADVANDSSEAADTVSKNFDSRDNAKNSFDLATARSFRADKVDTSSKPVVRSDVKMPSFANNTELLHTNSTEHHRSSQHRPSENGHSHDHKAKRTNHRTNRTAGSNDASQLHLTGVRDTKPVKSTGDEPMPKLKKESASPPLPHLPVLPLFATSTSETSDSSSHRQENKTATSHKKTTTLSSLGRNTSAGNNVRDINSLNISKPKPPTLPTTTAGVKTVTFNCDVDLHGGSAAKGKSKPKVR